MRRVAKLIVLVSLLSATSLSPAPGRAQTQPQKQDDPRLAARCAQLAGAANRYRGGRSESSYGSSSIVVSAQQDCQKGRYTQGIAALEKYLRGQRIPLPPE